jgi:hypothetical protein
MDAAMSLGEDWPETVPPCDELAEVECSGFMLCGGCAYALLLLVSIGSRVRRLGKEGA